MAMAKTVLQALKEIPEPHKRQGRQYPLYGLLAVLVLAALQGERSLRGMWQWASGREAEWLSYPSPGFRAVKRIPGLATFSQLVFAWRNIIPFLGLHTNPIPLRQTLDLGAG
jgi:hypothetical protein